MILFRKIKRATQQTIWNFFWNNFQLPQIFIEEIDPKFTLCVPRFLDDICLPPYKGNDKFIDYSILISLIKTIKPEKVLELGTAQGNTVANICSESDAQVYTVNALPEQIEGNIITFTLNKEEIGKVYKERGFENRVVQIYENTKNLDILDFVPPKRIDFAFLDACHDAEFVVNDFIKILPALSEQATVLLHDTFPSVEHYYLDSYLGCMYLRRIGYNIKHIENSSWGYWSAKDPYCKYRQTFRIKNQVHSIVESLFFGNHQGSIKSFRWLASGFLRGKFDNK